MTKISNSTTKLLKSRQSTKFHPNQWVVILTFIFVIIGISGIIFPPYLLISLASCSLIIILIPFWQQQKTDWFSMWNFVLYGTFMGIFVRSIYITFEIPDSASIQRVFLMDQNKEFLLYPALLILAGLISLSVGYLAGQKKPYTISLRIFESTRWDQKRIMFIAITILIINILALSTLIIDTGGLSIANISSKRFLAASIEDYNNHGYLRFTANIAQIIIYILLVKISLSTRRSIIDILLLIGSITLILLSAIYQSNRGAIIILLLNMVAILYYLNRQKIKISYTLLASAVSLYSFQLLTHLRSGYQLELSILGKSLNPIETINAIALNHNLFDVSKTAHIIMAIPDTLPYQWGRTLMLWSVAWIPRSLWQGKPIISIGQILGPSVFRSSATIGGGGVPPGIMAELYWNFSIPGVIFGCFFIGLFIRLIYTHFDAYRWNRNVIIIYVTSFMLLGFTLLGDDLSRTVVNISSTIIPLYLVLHFITKPVQG